MYNIIKRNVNRQNRLQLPYYVRNSFYREGGPPYKKPYVNNGRSPIYFRFYQRQAVLDFHLFFRPTLISNSCFQYLSLQKIRSLTVPTFFISGLADKLVPPEMMTELYKSCKSSCKRMFPVPGGSHNETWRRPDYYQQVLSFMHELREKPPVRSASTHWQIDEI